MPTVNFTRPELIKRKPQYALIRDALEGELVVKSRGVKYLPAPGNPVEDRAQEALRMKRYQSYLTRAVWYGVTERTLRGFVGQVFARKPEIEVPEWLTPVVGDMNGLGVNATQQAKGSISDVTAYGRGGLLSDFPTAEPNKPFSRDDLNSGKIKPSITRYEPEQIINWREVGTNGAKALVLVVLEEKVETYQAGDFAFTVGKQYRVLRLDESGFYIQEIYKDNNSAAIATYTPRDFSGNRLDYIPFEPIGSEDNDMSIDPAPMYAIASINMAHFRNSADYEESVYILGQPTPYFSGLDEDWVTNVLKDEPILLGARQAVMLPSGGVAGLLQVEPNTLAESAMTNKERQMVALGAKLVELKQVQRTATEANQEESAEASILSTIADNTSVAYAQALATCSRFVSDAEPKIKFLLNTTFELTDMDPAKRAQTILEWQAGALTFSEMRAVLRRAGTASLDDKEALTTITKEEEIRAKANDLNPVALDGPQADNNPDKTIKAA